jgi:minor extracellular protease Epr
MSDMLCMLPTHTVKSRVQILAEKCDYNHRMMNIPKMWNRTRGAGIKVAVLDTGCPQHVDLAPCGSMTAFPGYEHDTNGHSTHCGGIIAAIANNDMGVAGIAPDVDDYYGAVLNASGNGDIESIIKGIRWAVDDIGADVISMSLGIAAGELHFSKFEKACNYAVSQGVAVFAAAGNESGAVGQPAIYDSVIAVAAVNNRKDHAYFSNTGPEVDFAAGGVNVYSTYLDNSYAELSGTSMACPAAAAVGALILADSANVGIKLSPDELRAKLRKIAYDVGPDGFDELYGHGIPIFGSGGAPYDPPEEPAAGKPGPKWGIRSDCATWRVARNVISDMVDKLDNGTHIDNVLETGIRRLSREFGVVDSALRAQEATDEAI